MSVFLDTTVFNQTVCGLLFPKQPTRLSGERKQWTLAALREEVDEFHAAMKLEDEVDALIDLIYFAAGRLHEMGVHGDRAWRGVHEANMMKIRGELSKRPGSLGHDAIKPPGWTPPNYDWLKPVAKMNDLVHILETDVVGRVVDVMATGQLTVLSHGRYFTTTQDQVEIQ